MTKTNAELMKLWRRYLDINVTEAGRQLGLSPRSIEDIEQGRSRVDDVLTRTALESMVHDASHEYEVRTSALAAVAERERKRTSKRK